MRLNEGLERLGAKEIIGKYEYEGDVFCETAIEFIALPSTLKRIEAKTFANCKNLKCVEIPNGVEYLGKECFSGSGTKEITLPETLREICAGAF